MPTTHAAAPTERKEVEKVVPTDEITSTPCARAQQITRQCETPPRAQAGSCRHESQPNEPIAFPPETRHASHRTVATRSRGPWRGRLLLPSGRECILVTHGRGLSSPPPLQASVRRHANGWQPRPAAVRARRRQTRTEEEGELPTRARPRAVGRRARAGRIQAGGGGPRQQPTNHGRRGSHRRR